MLFGVQKNFFDLSSKLSFEGSYTYSGEFFIDEFENCGDSGAYKTFKDHTGIGFAPYIYHGIEYDLTQNISIDSGFIIPNIIMMKLQYSF